MILAKPIIGNALKKLEYMTGEEYGECLGNCQVMRNNLTAKEPAN